MTMSIHEELRQQTIKNPILDCLLVVYSHSGPKKNCMFLCLINFLLYCIQLPLRFRGNSNCGHVCIAYKNGAGDYNIGIITLNDMKPLDKNHTIDKILLHQMERTVPP